MYPVK